MIYNIVLLRLLDIITTKLAFEKYGGGVSIEGNPFSALSITRLGFPLFALVNLTISVLVLTILSRYSRVTHLAVSLFCIINLIVVFINIYAITI